MVNVGCMYDFKTQGRAPLLIPFLAYRTVHLIFMSFTLFNAKNISNALSEEVQSQLEEGKQAPDMFPAVLIFISAVMG